MSTEITREALKIQALKERLAEVEDQNANLRVELTILSHELETLRNEKDNDPNANVSQEEDRTDNLD